MNCIKSLCQKLIVLRFPEQKILRECTAEYKLSKSQEKINHLMYMDDIKLFAKKKKKKMKTLIQSTRIYSQDIGVELIRHRQMRPVSIEKRETIHDRRNRTTKARKNQNTRRKRKPTNTWEYWKLTPPNK